MFTNTLSPVFLNYKDYRGLREKNMNNYTLSQGTNPLTLRIVGTGEYVKQQIAHLVDYFDFIEFDRRQEIMNDSRDFND